MNEVEEFLKTKTFYCEDLKARISEAQCKHNRVRAHVLENKLERPGFATAPEDAENFFWKEEHDNPTSKCQDCPMYTGATPEEVSAMSSTTTLRRYPDTLEGAAERKLLTYRHDHQEMLYEEEERYLSRTSSKPGKMARLHIVVT
jgi:hypothetical protein